MARRGPKLPAPPAPGSPRRPDSPPEPARSPVDHSPSADGESLTYFAERFRRVALGLVAALITARAFFPSEPNLREGAGDGLVWVLLVFLTVGIALAVPLLNGCLRFRFTATDAFVVALITLVAASATHSLDRRPAINLAWEWAALGFVYLLLRNLPRTRNESSVLAGALVATAVAVSAYGLYQNKIELPKLQADFNRNPKKMLAQLNITPGTRSELMLRNRLLASTEPWSTFALANSLSGFIAGPIVILLAVGLFNLVRKDAPGSRQSALIMAAPLVLVLLLCLTLGKSRSAYLGVATGLFLLALRARRTVPRRVFLAVGLSGALVVAALVIAGLATKRLDPQVLTQSTKSLRYRAEYWQGAWGVITDGEKSLASALAHPISHPTFWLGIGPGNFAGPYLQHMLPTASEEIVDPHNLFLEVWATAGFLALLCLLAALGWAFWNMLGPPSPAVPDRTQVDRLSRRARRRARALGQGGPPAPDPDDLPPARTGWLMLCAGAGWGVVVLFGWLDPFQGDLFPRWLILGGAWLIAALLLVPLWKRLPIPAIALAAGALAMLVNLLASGGIGIPTVALGLWSIIALGQNLRDDRNCSYLREYQSRTPSLGLAVAWSAALGTFLGLVLPFWQSQTAVVRGETEMSRMPPNDQAAEQAFLAAATEDRYSARPWLSLAALYERQWRLGGSKVEDRRWKKVPIMYLYAAHTPRNPKASAIHNERAIRVHDILLDLAPRLSPLELTEYRGIIVEATRTASTLNPTNSELHARLAHASADINMYRDAVTEANEALRLDRLTPHEDRKLPEPVRRRLEDSIPKWSAAADKMPPLPASP
jgi:O-antigen ligase